MRYPYNRKETLLIPTEYGLNTWGLGPIMKNPSVSMVINVNISRYNEGRI